MLDPTPICKYHISEVVASVFLDKFQPLLFIGILYELAICPTMKGSAQHCPATKRGQGGVIAEQGVCAIGWQRFRCST